MLEKHVISIMKRFLTVFAAILSFVIARGEEPYKGYRAYVDMAWGDAYNLNTAQPVSANNMQLYCMTTTTHGYRPIEHFFFGSSVIGHIALQR